MTGSDKAGPRVGKTICERTSLLPRSCVVSGHLAAVGVSLLTCGSPATGKGSMWRAQNVDIREIARRLNRAPSTISREVRRNASTRTCHLEYKASIAQWHAERRDRRPKTAKLVANDRLRSYVQDRL